MKISKYIKRKKEREINDNEDYCVSIFVRQDVIYVRLILELELELSEIKF